MENVSGPAVIISNENNPRTEINMENVTCRRVPTFATYRESGKSISGPAETYSVQTFSHGLQYQDIGSEPAIRDIYETTILSALPNPVTSDIFGTAADRYLDKYPYSWRQGGRYDRRYRCAEKRHRPAPNDLLALGQLSRNGYDQASAGHSSRRTASERHAHTPGRFHSGVSGRGSPKPLLETPDGGTKYRDWQLAFTPTVSTRER